MSPRLSGALMVAASLALVGANVPLGKIVVAQWPVTAFLVWRFALSVLVLLPMAWRGLPAIAAMPVRAWALLTVQAAVGMIGFTWFMLEGVRVAGAVTAGIVAGSLPAVTALLAVLLLREGLTWRRGGAVVAAGAGVASLALTGQAATGIVPEGVLLVLGAVVCEALFIIAARALNAGATALSPAAQTLAVNALGLPMAAALHLVAGEPFAACALAWEAWAIAALYVLNASVFALVLWYRGLAHVEAGLAGVLKVMIPATAALLGIALLGEAVTPAHAAGFTAIVAAIVLAAPGRAVSVRQAPAPERAAS